MCFGGGDNSSSREMIQMQKDEQKEARAKEEKRQARIKAGLQKIKEAFGGRPEIKAGTAKFDWNKFKAPEGGFKAGAAIGGGLPAGYSYVQLPGTSTASASPSAIANLNAANPTLGVRPPGGWREAGGSTQRTGGPNTGGGGSSTPGAWAIKGPDGKIYKVGEDVTYGTPGQKGMEGFGKSFYDEFKQGMLDYYNPQVLEKYGDAKDETTFRHARAGTLNSSSAADSAADLAKQNLINVGEVRNQADKAAGALKNSVAEARAKAEGQVMAVENPEVAVNQALAAVANLSAEKPSLTPLGDIFNIATIGGASYLNGANNAALSRKYVPGKGGYGATRIANS